MIACFSPLTSPPSPLCRFSKQPNKELEQLIAALLSAALWNFLNHFMMPEPERLISLKAERKIEKIHASTSNK